MQNGKTVKRSIEERHRLAGKGGFPPFNSVGFGLRKVKNGDSFRSEGGVILHGGLALEGDLGTQRGVRRQHEINTALKKGDADSALNTQCGADVIDGSGGAGAFGIPNILLIEGERMARRRLQVLILQGKTAFRITMAINKITQNILHFFNIEIKNCG